MILFKKIQKCICLLLYIMSIHLYAQKLRCGTTEYEEFIFSQNPDLRMVKDANNDYIRSYLQSSNFTSQRSSGNIITIPVIVHLIGNNVIAACSSKVQEQINILNQDYRKMVGTNGNGNG